MLYVSRASSGAYYVLLITPEIFVTFKITWVLVSWKDLHLLYVSSPRGEPTSRHILILIV
jgi:hypothetical protein